MAVVALLCGACAGPPTGAAVDAGGGGADAGGQGPVSAGPPIVWTPVGTTMPLGWSDVVPTPCSDAGWCWVRPRPQGAVIRGVWAASASDVWAVGDYDTILHRDTTGWHVWTLGQSAARPTENLGAIDGTAAGDVWAVTNFGTVFHYDGTRWQSQHVSGLVVPENASAYSGVALWAGSASNVWIATLQGKVAHFDGQSWHITQALLEGGGHLRFWSISGTGPDDVWIGSRSGRVVHWDGARFSEIAAAPQPAITLLARADHDVWAAGDALHHWNGNRWLPVTAVGAPISSLTLGSAGAVWAAGGSNVYRYDGTAWQTFGVIGPDDNGGDPMYPPALWNVAAAGAGFQVATGGPTLFSHAQGGPWTRESSRYLWYQELSAIWGTSDSDVWVAGDGVASHWNGATWTAYHGTGLAAFDPSALWGDAANDLYACSGDQVLRWDGTRWAVFHTLPDACLSIAGTGADDVWVGGESTLSHYDGSTWSVARSNVHHAGGVWAIAPDDVWYGDSTGVYQFDGTRFVQRYPPNAAHVVDPAPPAPEVRDIWASGPNDVWVASDFTSLALLHWDGTHMAPVVVDSSTNVQIRKLARVFGTGPDDVWAVADGGAVVVGTAGRVYHWDGARWSRLPLPTWQVTDVWASGQSTWAAAFAGSVFRRPRASSAAAAPHR